MNAFFTLVFFFSFSLLSGLFGQGYIGILGGRNSGEHIFETGNKYPNLSGIKGGSRITYDRNYSFGGIEGGYTFGKLNLEGKFATTGWSVKTKESRDEDFLMGDISTERRTKFSLNPLFLHDTAHTYTGTQNFADGKAHSTVFEQRISLFGKYYFSGNSADPWESKDRFFVTFGFRYNYFKYVLYDVMQYVRFPFFYGPIGNGLSYAHSGFEYGGGGGYTMHFGRFRIEPSLIILIGFNRFRDYHVQRDLNFYGENDGLGFIAKLLTSYSISEKTQIRLSYEAHRMFTTGYFRTKGGLNFQDYSSNYVGKFNGNASTKEAYIELGVITKLTRE